jgi:hypothetical protein
MRAGDCSTLTLAVTLVLSTACGPLDLVEAPDPSVGLVAYWSFDESTGSLVGDHSGQGHDGVLTGGTWRSTGGHLGGALSLASGDYVTVEGFPAATPDWTLSVWVRYAPADIGTDLSTIVTTEIPSTGGWELQGPVNADTAALQFSYNRDSRYNTLSCCQIQPDTWMHVTAVVNGAAPGGQRTATIYDGRTAHAVLPVSGPILPGNGTLHIGIEEIPGKLEWPFRGTIDELRIYDRALNPAEVQALDALSL